MNETILSQIEFLLSEMEKYKKNSNKKIADLNQTIFIRNTRIKELKTELNNENSKLVNDDIKDIGTLQNINKIIEKIKSELEKEENVKKQLAKEKDELKKMQQVSYKLEKSIKENKEKYENLLATKKEYLEKYNSKNINSNIKEMYKNEIEIINLQIDNMDILLNRMLTNCKEKIPIELKEKLEQKYEDKTKEENKEIEIQKSELKEKQQEETEQIIKNDSQEDEKESQKISQSNKALEPENKKEAKGKKNATKSLIEKINDKKAQMALGIIAMAVLGIYMITNPTLAIALLGTFGYREYNKGKKL